MVRKENFVLGFPRNILSLSSSFSKDFIETIETFLDETRINFFKIYKKKKC